MAQQPLTPADLLAAQKLLDFKVHLSDLAAGKATEDDLIQFVLNECERLTQSSIGFFHYVHEDQNTLTLQMWSANTLANMYTAEAKGWHYPVDEAGVWVDCVYQRAPVICNDYQALPHKKGMPEGHAPVERFVTVPIMRGEKIRAIMGVGNKPVDYDEADVQTLEAITSESWEAIIRKRAEAELRQAEEKYRQIFEYAVEGIFQSTPEGRFISVNPALARMWGYESPDVLIDSVTDIMRQVYVDPDRRAEFIRLLNEQDEVYGFEFQVYRKDGSVLWVSENARGVRDEGGALRYYEGTIQDITERVQAERALRDQAALQRLIITISNRFINLAPEEVDSGIQVALGEIGEFMAVDRSYVFLLSEDALTMDNTHEWCAAGIEAQIDNLKGLPADIFPWWMAKLRRFEDILIPRVTDLPPEASAEKEILQAQDIQSLIVVPLTFARKLVGFLGFDAVRAEKTWPEETSILLRIVGEIIINAIQRQRTQDALRRSEEKFRLLAESAQDLIYRYEFIPQRGFTYVSPAATTITGYTPEEHYADPELGFKLVHPDDRHLLTEISQGGEAIRKPITLRWQRKDGATIWTEQRNVPVYDANGNLAAIEGVARDITGHKQAEEAIRKYSQQLASVVEIEHALAASLDQEQIHATLMEGVQQLFPDVATIFLSGFDEERQIIRALRGLQDGELVDVSRLPEIPLAPEGEGAQSRVIRTRQPLVINTGLKDASHRVLVKVTSAKENGRETQSAIYAPMLAQDKVLGLIQCQSYAADRFTEEDIKTLSLVANTAAVAIQNARSYQVARDEIRERKQAEEGLRASEERYRALVEASPDAITLTDLESHVLMCNPQTLQLHGFDSLEEAVGISSFEFVAPEDRQRAMDNALTMLQEGKVNGHEYTLLRKDGARFQAELNVSMVRDTRGQPTAFIGVTRDITERVQVKEDLLHSNTLISALSRVAAQMDALRDPKYILEIMGDGLKEMGIDSIVVLSHPDAQSFGIEYVSIEPRLLAVGEKILGVKLSEYHIPYNKSTSQELLEVLERRQALFVPNPIELTKTLFPGLKRKVVQQAIKVAGINLDVPVLYLPMLSEEQVIGVVGVWGPDLRESDLPALTVFASQATAALLNARLHAEIQKELAERVQVEEEIRQLNAELEQRVAQRTHELQSSEERYRQLVDSSPDAIAVHCEGKIVFVNPATVTLSGATNAEELLGRPALEMVHPNSRAAALARIRASYQQGVPAPPLEEKFLRLDGSTVDVEVVANPTTYHGKPAMQIVARDISERKRAEERFRQVVEAASNGFIMIDARERIQLVNAQAERIFGYTRQQLTGLNVEMLIPERWREPHTGLRAAFMADPQDRAMGVGRELFGLRSDGVEFPIEIGLSTITIEGETYTLASVADISERKQAEESLRHTHSLVFALSRVASRLRSTLVPEQIFETLDQELKQLDVYCFIAPLDPQTQDLVAQYVFTESKALAMAEKLAGVSARGFLFHRKNFPLYEQLIEQKQHVYTHDIFSLTKPLLPGLPEAIVRRVAGLIGAGSNVPGILLPLQSEKEVIGMLTVWGENLHESDIPAFSVFAGQVASAIRTAELYEQARAASRAKSEFLARMSHELRTPMNSILGFAQLLTMSQKEPLSEAQQERAGRILQAGRHLLELINEVLDIARIETGKMVVPVMAVDLCQVVEETLEMVRPQAAGRQIEIDVQRPPGQPAVLADRQRLRQVLLNLLDNAVKYNRAGGRVTITCDTLTEGAIRLAVRDTGNGIPPDQIARLFTPFERLGAEGGEIEGTGLGLAISKRLVELMSGEMGVESTEGQGSTFWVKLLQSEADALPARPGSGPLPLIPSATFEYTVLYIEDNPANLELVEQALAEQPQIRLISAIQGGMGLQLAQQHHPDLILLDMHLPDMHGMAVLQRLGEMEATRETPVVILSADAMPDQIEQLMQAGAQAYLTKPLNIPEFLQTLEQVLRRK